MQTMPVPEGRLKQDFGDFPSTSALSAEWELISGLEEVAAHQPQLVALADRCGQPGTMDFLDYFLTVPYFDVQVPHALLRRSRAISHILSSRRSKLPRLLLRRGPGGVEAAVLLLEYRLRSLPTGLLIPVDGDGFRSVIAPADQRGTVARQAAEWMLKRGKALVLISYMEGAENPHRKQPIPFPEDTSARFQQAPRLIATQLREASRRLPLKASLDATLAAMGSDTRRTLRRYQRRVVNDFGAVFVPQAELTLAEFQEMNRACMYAVPDWAARWRYESARSLVGGVFAGLRAADGRWLSLVGAHRHDDTVHLDWQMNLLGFGSLSLVSAMRAFLIADEIQQGMRWMRFEAGTPHSMSSAFVKEYARDLLFASRLLPPGLLKSIAGRFSTGGPLVTALTSDSLIWRT